MNEHPPIATFLQPVLFDKMDTDRLIELDRELKVVLARRKSAECAKDGYLIQGTGPSESEIISMRMSVWTPLGMLEFSRGGVYDVGWDLLGFIS